MLDRYFPHFRAQKIELDQVSIQAMIGGSGPPLLLLHGWPQNLLEWHRIAPRLADTFTVVATDLRGYGRSGHPVEDSRDTSHSAYCKRVMASDQVAVMRQLGFERFAVVGHDRGGRVAHRMALDFPDCVSKLAVLDIVPTLHVYSTVNKALATAYYHWFFLIQPTPVPETLLAGQGEFLLRTLFRSLDEQAMPRDVFADYVRCFNDPATLHAMCEDYRAAASVDLEHDRVDLDQKVLCPMQVLWGERGAMHALYDVLDTWRGRTMDLCGGALPGGHWLPEEVPDRLYSSLRKFLG